MMMTTMILLHLQYEVDDVVEEDGYDHRDPLVVDFTKL
jgi:hypothetical protein